MKMQEPELIAKTLRAVLHPFKNGIPLSELQGEYKSLTGEWIPFRHLGHGTLEGYLQSIPGVVRMEGNKMGEVRISYSSEMVFVFLKCAWFITLPLPVPWISDKSTVACVWCTNAGRSGSCGIEQVPLIFLSLHADWEVVFAKGGILQRIFLETRVLAGKKICVTVELGPCLSISNVGGMAGGGGGSIGGLSWDLKDGELVCVLIISSAWSLASSFSCSETVVSAVACKPDNACFRLSTLVCHELQCRRTVKPCQGEEEPLQVRCLDARVAVPQLSSVQGTRSQHRGQGEGGAVLSREYWCGGRVPLYSLALLH